MCDGERCFNDATHRLCDSCKSTAPKTKSITYDEHCTTLRTELVAQREGMLVEQRAAVVAERERLKAAVLAFVVNKMHRPWQRALAKLFEAP